MQNKSRLKIWICEFVSAGGLASQPLPASLLKEGLLMRDALLNDLASLGVDCITSHDLRVTPPSNIESVPVGAGEDAWAIWRAQMMAADIDACWVIAPETGHTLHRLCAMVADAGKPWIGCSGEAILDSGSKSAMATKCRQAGIPVIPHQWLSQAEPLQDLPWFQAAEVNGWVIKPDDGAGCDLTFYFNKYIEVIDFILQNNSNDFFSTLLVQPYVPGKALSMSVLSTTDKVSVMAAHQQHLSIEQGQFRFHGAGVNQAADHRAAMQAMAEKIHQSIPGLHGYWGADMILTAQQTLMLVEINPRLTTPYIGLASILTENPAAMILQAALNNQLSTRQAHTSMVLTLAASKNMRVGASV